MHRSSKSTPSNSLQKELEEKKAELSRNSRDKSKINNELLKILPN